MEDHDPGYYLQSFIEENPSYSKIKATDESKTIGEFCEINTFEDDVWMLQCPKGTDLTRLQGEKLKFPGRSNVHDLEAVAVEYASPINQSFGYSNRKLKHCLRVLPIRGSILLRNRLKAKVPATAEQIELSSPKIRRVPVPEGIKLRHPLLGVQFEEKLKMNEATAERLRIADEKSTQAMRETRNKSRAVRNTIDNRSSPFKKFKLENDDTDVDITSKNGKKNRKHIETVITLQNNHSLEKEIKKKKSKKAKEGSIDREQVSKDLEWLKNI